MQAIPIMALAHALHGGESKAGSPGLAFDVNLSRRLAISNQSSKAVNSTALPQGRKEISQYLPVMKVPGSGANRRKKKA